MSIRAPSSGLAAGSAACKVKKGRLFGQLPSAFLANIYAISPPIAIFRPSACGKSPLPCVGITKMQYASAHRPATLPDFRYCPRGGFAVILHPKSSLAPPPRNSAAAAPHRKKKRIRAAPLPYGTTAAPSVSPFFCAPVARAALRPPSLRSPFSPFLSLSPMPSTILLRSLLLDLLLAIVSPALASEPDTLGITRRRNPAARH